MNRTNKHPQGNTTTAITGTTITTTRQSSEHDHAVTQVSDNEAMMSTVWDGELDGPCMACHETPSTSGGTAACAKVLAASWVLNILPEAAAATCSRTSSHDDEMGIMMLLVMAMVIVG